MISTSSKLWLLWFVIIACFSNTATAEDCPQPLPANEGDTAFVILCSALVFLMTPGVAFFYGGMVRFKSVVNTLMMSYISMSVIIIQWVLVGYTFSFAPGIGFIGGFKWGALKGIDFYDINVGYSRTIPHIVFVNFQMMFAVVTPALISGGIVERFKFTSYVLFIFLWTFLYDINAHLLWANSYQVGEDGQCTQKQGWLRELGAIDFAGGTVIHISAGFSALVAALFVKKRKERNAPATNIPYVMLGAALLWFGWLGFNGGSAVAANASAGFAVINSSISAAAGFFSWVLLETFTKGKPSAVGAVTGAICGHVANTPASGYIHPGWAILFGLVAGVIAFGCKKMTGKFLEARNLEDSSDVFIVHGVSGIVGALMTGMFASKDMNPFAPDGAFYGNPHLLWKQLVAVIMVILISVVGTALILLVLKYSIGFSFSEDYELRNIDILVHGENVVFHEENNIFPISALNDEKETDRSEGIVLV